MKWRGDYFQLVVRESPVKVPKGPFKLRLNHNKKRGKAELSRETSPGEREQGQGWVHVFKAGKEAERQKRLDHKQPSGQSDGRHWRALCRWVMCDFCSKRITLAIFRMHSSKLGCKHGDQLTLVQQSGWKQWWLERGWQEWRWREAEKI